MQVSYTISDFVATPHVQAIRSELDHPILDGDAHQIEFLPLVRDIACDLAGPSVANRIGPLRSRGEPFPVPNGFGLHARNTLDRVTATLPKLLYDRLDEIGLDFAVLYPTLGLSVDRRDPEERQVLARALNIY